MRGRGCSRRDCAEVNLCGVRISEERGGGLVAEEGWVLRAGKAAAAAASAKHIW